MGFRTLLDYTSSPCYPQSNGKAEGTLYKVDEKIIRAAWTGRYYYILIILLMMIANSPERYSSTITLPHARTDNLLLKNCSAILFRTPRQLTVEPLIQNGKEVL